MLKIVSFIGLAAALSACQPDAQTNNPAVATDAAVEARERTAPATGATSFTEAQAQDHLESKGYTNPTALVLTEAGLWVGRATFNGETLNVSVDYQGNVVVK